MTITVGAPELHRISEDIWSAILGLELEPTAHDEVYPPAVRVLTGLVQITGDWTGAVTIEVPAELGREVAAIMFGMEPDEPSDEEIRDTIGELANMTGGNVKSTIGGSCQLSLPSVTEGLDYSIAIPGSHVRERVAFHYDGHLIVVTMIEQDGDKR